MTPEADLSQFLTETEAVSVAPTPEPPSPSPVSHEDKVAFLGHILTGVPFMKRYDLGGFGFVEFATVPSLELDAIRRLTQALPANARQPRLRSLLAAASVNRLELDGRILEPVLQRTWDTESPYAMFLLGKPSSLIEAIEHLYDDFSHTLNYMISKVSDRSFWPTP